MRRSDNRAALTDEVARFQADVQQLALAAVRAIVKQELDRKRAKLPAVRPGAGTLGRTNKPAVPAATTTREPPAAKTREPPATAEPHEPPVAAATHGPPVAARTREPSAASPAEGRKRVPWTREAIISELASWMLSGTAIDASFVTRHGPPGLVAATRRVFGRFEAALNVAGLHVSKLYPDGPPDKAGIA